MANTLRIKRSTGSSAPTSLANAELAFSEGNETLFVGKGTGGAGGSATSIIKIGGIGGFFDKDTVRSANAVLSGPTTGSDAAPTFRALVAADIPSIVHTKISDFDTGVRTNTLNQMAAPTGAVSLNSQKITGLADPTADADAANKGYVDGVAQGLDVKDSVVATTTANGTLSTAFANGQSIDGVTLQTGDRILIKNQSTASQNGIYNVNASGAPSRTTDMGTGSNAAGAFVFVEEGTINAENGFTCTSDTGSAVVGTNNLTFAQFSGAGQIIAGDGLDKSGNTLSVDLKSNGGLVIESTEIAVKLDASSITGTLAIGDGGTGATSATAALTALGLSNYAKTLIDDADAAAARTTLGLGSIATQAANSVAITGGSVTNLTTFDGITVDGGSY
nr:phage-related tail fiber protein [uncultured Mediterranean phage uvMED]BAR38713.1 phage-related tail fiber protein [uncultured Mediterranean phage uvMED]